MTKVICLVGASGSGKTTIAKELEKTGYNIIQSFTTRYPREDGKWGHTFIKDYEIYLDAPIDGDNTGWVCEIYDKIRHKTYFKDNMIAYFNSYNSGHHYFATDEQVVRGKSNIYIVDPDGANQVKKYYKNKREPIQVKTIVLAVDHKVREQRLHKRELRDLPRLRSGKTKLVAMKKANIKHRLEKDKEIFSVIDCDYVIDGNRDVEEVKKDLVAAIERS